MVKLLERQREMVDGGAYHVQRFYQKIQALIALERIKWAQNDIDDFLGLVVSLAVPGFLHLWRTLIDGLEWKI